MNPVYANKSLSEWITTLRSGNEAERCAAALALADLPQTADSVASLKKALSDPDRTVQAAARIGLGLDPVAPEFRRKMLDGLIGADDYERHTILQRLAWLTTPEALARTTAPAIAEIPVPRETPLAKPDAAAGPDIAVVTLPPWWLLTMAVAFLAGMSWLLRTLWWPKWPMAALAVAGVVFFIYLMGRENLSKRRFHARARLCGAAFVGGAISFCIGWFFPASIVLIDNANEFAVRCLVNDVEWITVGAHESTSCNLRLGKCRVAVQSADGKVELDVLDIDVPDKGPFVLNILGSQTYFDGTVHYGGNESGFKLSREKWFRLPEVDYLFREPPDMIEVQAHGSKVAQRRYRTFFTKGTPPRFFVGN